MTEQHGEVVIECSQTVDRPSQEVWQSIRRVRSIVMPEQIIREWDPADEPLLARPRTDAAASGGHAGLRHGPIVDDALLVLTLEVNIGQSVSWSPREARLLVEPLSWSPCEARLRVEPLGAEQARLIMTCLVMPTNSPSRVEEMLRGLIMLSLQALKRRLEAQPSPKTSTHETLVNALGP